MEAYFNIGEYENILITPEINYSDVMDGTTDTITFAFRYNEDITDNVQLKQKCNIMITDEYHKLYEIGYIETNNYYINDNTYIYSDGKLYYNNEPVAEVYNDTIWFDNYIYFIKYNKIYEDKRYYKYMCLTQITSEKLSTATNNGYMITVSLKEQTILLKDCIRTDIAISPYLYPQIETGEVINGIKQYRNLVFNNLYDAVLKIVDCHNMCILNDTILNIDNELVEDLKKIPCPTLTYRDLSTYSQLYDIFIRIGRIPYYENGTLYGIKLDGTKTENTKDLTLYSSLSNMKEEGVNDTIYSSKVYNNVYDNEYAVVPNIFSDLVAGYEQQKYLSDDEISSNNILSKEELKIFLGSKTTSTKAFEGTSVADLNTQMDTYLQNEYDEWLNMTYNEESDLSKTLLYVNGFNSSSAGIEDARSYYLELPYGIEQIEDIYMCRPRMLKFNTGQGYTSNNTIGYLGTAHFGWSLKKLDRNKYIENTIYENLSSLQKRTTAYYVRGNNKISNIICALIEEGDDSIFTVSEEDLKGSFAWSNTRLYKLLRSCFFVVKYKPISNTTYTNYNYVKDLGEVKPTSINNLSLPYSQVSDKQVYPVLEYNLQKGSDNTYNVKFITTDTTILDVSAGDIVLFHDREFIVAKVQRFINNKTIECSFEINDKIIQNSILSSYKDSVRITQNISSDSSVNRQIHIFGENVITLTDGLFDEENENILTYNNFIQEIGQNMVNASFYKNGLFDNTVPYSDALLNVYGNLSKYPIRTSTAIPTQTVPNDTLIIRIDSDFNVGYEEPIGKNRQHYYYGVNENDFPITILRKKYNALTNVSTYTILSIVNTLNDLENIMPEYGAYVSLKNGVIEKEYNSITLVLNDALPNDKGYTYTESVINNIAQTNTVVDIRPPYRIEVDGNNGIEAERVRGWATVDLFMPFLDLVYSMIVKYPWVKGNYVTYDKLDDFSSSIYLTEKLISTTGLITKIDYSTSNANYSGSVFSTEGDLQQIALPSTVGGILIDQHTKIERQVPAIFNTTTYGCILNGVGKSLDDFYSLYILPHFSGVGYYLDIRETPRPYIQYKTRGMNSNVYDIHELNSDYEWLSTVTAFEIINPFVKAEIHKIPKRKSVNDFEISEETKLYNATIYEKMNNQNANYSKYGNGKVTFNLGANFLTYNDEYDYCLVLFKQDNSYVNLIKFNVNKYSYVSNVINLNSTIYTNYNI